MSEMKSLTDSVKSGLYDQLLNSIDQEFSEETIAPPAELVPYLEGQETCEESRRIREMYEQWSIRVGRAFGRKAVTLEQVLDAMPESYALRVKTVLVEALQKKKGELS